MFNSRTPEFDQQNTVDMRMYAVVATDIEASRLQHMQLVTEQGPYFLVPQENGSQVQINRHMVDGPDGVYRTQFNPQTGEMSLTRYAGEYEHEKITFDSIEAEDGRSGVTYVSWDASPGMKESSVLDIEGWKPILVSESGLLTHADSYNNQLMEAAQVFTRQRLKNMLDGYEEAMRIAERPRQKGFLPLRAVKALGSLLIRGLR